MTEINLYEALPELNGMGVLGRVVVTHTFPAHRKFSSNGKIFWCCNRAFLTEQSFRKHRDGGCAPSSITNHASPGVSEERHALKLNGRRPREEESDSEDEEDARRDELLLPSPPKRIGLNMFENGDADSNYSSLSPLSSHCNNGSMSVSSNGFQGTSPRISSSVTNRLPTGLRHRISPGSKLPNLPSVADILSFFHTKKVDDGPVEFHCRQCTYITHEIRFLRRHAKVHGYTETGTPKIPTNQKQNDYSDGYIQETLTPYYETPGSTTLTPLHRCTSCAYRTRFRSNFRTHMKTSHNADGAFSCKFCSCRYRTKYGLTSHMKTHKQVRVPLNRVGNSKRKSERLTCTQESSPRNKPTAMKDTYVANWVESVSVELDLNNRETKSSEESRHVTTAPSLNMGHQYLCRFCTKTFATKFNLFAHCRERHIKPSNNQANLSESYKLDNISVSGENTKACNVCNETFPEISQLFAHQTICLKDDESYHCTNQGDSGTGTFELNEDLEFSPSCDEQLDQKPMIFNCDLCGFTAIDAAELTSHRKSSHVICGVECSCGCSFNTATELTFHKNNSCRNSEVKHVVNTNVASSELKNDSGANASIMDIDTTPTRSSRTCACGEFFKTRGEFLTHKRNKTCHIFSDDSKNSIDVEESAPSDNTKVHEKQELVNCSKCSYTTTSHHGLKVHDYQIHAVQEYQTSCQICNYRTPTFQAYTYHKKTCHIINGIKCPECPCSFKSIEGLTGHVLQRHKKKLDRSTVSLKCEQCDFSCYLQRELESHRKNVHINGVIKIKRPVKDEVLLTCDKCDFTTTLIWRFRYHCSTSHVDNGFQCDICTCRFKTEQGRRGHMIYLHNTLPEEHHYRCGKCTFSTTSEQKLIDHISIHHVENGFQCSDCSYSFSTEAGRRSHMLHVHPNKNNYTECELCGYHTSNQKNYRAHKMTCHAENGVQCPECPCRMKHIEGLRIHFRLMHKTKIFDESSFLLKCDICDYQTFIEDKLDRHKKRYHVEGGLECLDCNFCFESQIELERHLHIKHGEESVKEDQDQNRDPDIYTELCKECNFRSKTPTALKMHCHKKHGLAFPVSPKKNIVCDLCNRVLTESVVSHKMRCHVENGFKCAHCCCTFETLASKDRHMVRWHNVDPTRKCNICGLRFSETRSRHMERCHVENGWKCGHCKCSFETEQARAMHANKRHGIVLAYSQKEVDCTLCGVKLRETLKNHLKRCHVENGFKCAHCCCSFETMQSRVHHLKKVHKIIVKKKCTICGLSFSGTIQLHMQRCHVENGWKCEHCSCSFASEGSRAMHATQRHGIGTGVLRCTLCGVKSTDSLPTHMKRCHVKNGIQCPYCCCSFESELGRSVHIRFRHANLHPQTPKQCAICGILPLVPMRMHLKQSHVKNGFQCSQCACSFETKRILIRHLARYHQIVVENTKKCEICGILLKSRSLHDHLRNNHVKKGYACKYCPCSFRNKLGRQTHTNFIHKVEIKSAEAPAETKDPGNATESRLADTERSHSMRKRFQCGVCSCRFNSLLEKNSHVISRHKLTAKGNEKSNTSLSAQQNTSLKCILCGVTVSNLSRHLMTHHVTNGFQCAYCSCRFANEKGRSIHYTLVHSNIINKAHDEISAGPTKVTTNPNLDRKSEDKHSRKSSEAMRDAEGFMRPKESLVCSKCGYLATCASHLNIHMQKSHVKNSPYPCRKCSCSYGTETELLRHQKVFHPHPVRIVKELTRTFEK